MRYDRNPGWTVGLKGRHNQVFYSILNQTNLLTARYKLDTVSGGSNLLPALRCDEVDVSRLVSQRK